MLQKFVFAILILVLALPLTVTAQEVPAPQPVTIAATDGRNLIGDYYRPETEGDVPAVLLLHMLGNRRQSWEPLIPVLLDANVAVLNMDIRGHGETGGSRDWDLAADIQTLLDWLRGQEGVSNVSLIGASIGSNLALRGMANDADVVTAIALSPGLSYQGVTTDDAVESIGARPILFVAGRGDNPAGPDTQELFNRSSGDSQIRLYTDRRHGTNMFPDNEPLLNMIAAWVLEHAS